MVTRKTRVLSAFAALLMLVSLFTCITLPATAAVATQPSGLKAYKARTASDTATDYAITDVEDWLRFVADSNGNADYGPLKSSTPQSFSGYNLWLTADLDFKGVDLDVDGDGTIELHEFCVSTDTTRIADGTNKDDDFFYGNFYGQGHSIKNLVVDLKPAFKSGAQAFGLFAYTSTAKIMDLTIDESCSFTVRGTTNGVECYVGVFCGYSANNAWFINCKNEASLDFYDEGTNKTNSISCFGRKQRGYLVNCINTGALTNHDIGRVTVFAEWMNSTTTGRNVYMYNCVNTGVLTTAGDYTTGLVSTNGTDSIANQILAYNIYAVGCHIGSGNDLNLIDPKGTYWEDFGVEKTGELAFLMNKGYDTKYDGTYGRKYYTVKDQNIAFGTAAEQPIKLNFTFGKVEETIYAIADANGELDLATLYPIAGAIYEASAGTVDGNILTATPGAEIDVMVTSTVLIYDYLQEAINYYKARNVAFFQDADGVALTSELINDMQNKIDNEGYADQTAIDYDLAVLKNDYSFVKSNTVSMADYDLYADVAVKFSVATKEEMAKLLTVGADMSAETVIYVTDDIDMEGSASNRVDGITGAKFSIDGGNHTIEDLYVTNAFLSYYQGAFVKDLTFKNGNVISAEQSSAFLIDKVQYDLTVSNVKLDGVVGESTYDGGGMQGLLICQITDGADVTVEDITIINSTMNRPAGTTYWNSGLLLGKTYSATLLIDGVYLEGNTVDGERTAGTGRGVAIGEIICNADIKNMVILNTTAEDAYVDGIFSVIKEHGSSYDVDPTITIKNIIAYNNGEMTNFAQSGTASAGSTITFTDIYADTAAILSNATYEGYTVEDSCVVDAAAAITSGEAAWALNKALAGDKWTMENGLPAFGTEDDQTVRVVIEMEDIETEYAYVNLDDTTTLTHTVPNCTFALKNTTDSSFASIDGNQLTFTSVPTDELTLTLTAVSGELYFVALDAKIAEIEEKADFYLDAEGTKTVADALATIKGRRASSYEGYTQKQIQDDLALLNTYVLTEVDADSKATLQAAKAELEAFGENISYFVQADAMLAALAKINDVLDDAPANGFEALQINTVMQEAAEAYNAIGERTIVEGKVVPLKLYELFSAYTNDWTVADETDWREGVENINTNTKSEGMTITLLNDIDMTADGDDSAVLPLAYTKYFNGVLDGQGHVFKNLKIDVKVSVNTKEYAWVGLVCALGEPGVVKNLGIESGSVQLTSSSTANARLGAVVAYAYGGSVIQNCWNAASVTLTLQEGAQTDAYVGGIVGSGVRWSTVDGCYNLGAVHSDGKHAAGINGWTQGGDATYAHGRVYNSFNYGTVTSAVNPTYIGAVRTGGGSVGSVANSYAIGTKLVFIADSDEKIEESSSYSAAMTQNNEENSDLPAEIYTTGELAWKLNRGYAEGYSNQGSYPDATYANFVNYEEFQTYYTLKDGKTVFGAEENQTVRVTVKHDDIENYIYVNADVENYDLGEQGTYVLETGSAAITDGRYLTIDSPEDIVITVSVPDIVEGNHAHADCMGYTNNENGTHTPYCDYEVTIDGRTFTCDYEEETATCSEFTYAADRDTIDEKTHAHQAVATCAVCGYGKTVACAAGFEEDVTLAPGCESLGEKTFTCLNACGYSYIEEIEATGHDKVYTPAGNDQHTVTCNNCTTYSDVEGCTPNEETWNETQAPSVNDFGARETTCTVCGGIYTEQLAKLAAATVTAGINTEETEATATVALLNNPGVKTVTVKVAFDYTVMELKAVAAESGLAVGAPVVEGGVVTFTVTAENEFTDDMNIAVVTFTMKTEEGELVASNRDYELKVTAEATNAAGEPVAMKGSEDIFTVTKGKDVVKGDLSGDKVIDVADAVLLLRYVTGAELPESYQGLITDDMADLTDEGDGADLGDGQVAPEVNINDVLYLLRYLNGWINVL